VLYLFSEEEWSAHRVADGQQLWSQPLRWDSIHRITPDAAVQQIAACMMDGTIAIHRLSDGVCTGRVTGHANPAGECGWSPDGTRLFSASPMGDIRIWYVPTAREIATLGRCASFSHSLHVTGDGQRLLLGDYGGFWTAPR
jgi:WD40 repeat protein